MSPCAEVPAPEDVATENAEIRAERYVEGVVHE